ncbi:hypothetical protein [Amycolatopsis sp. CA-230715]|uniref:hypothetical protein n=1 Tax=Amycolatopsis sp. CA-230715 TaxID=2745196 RepID=UPI001C00CDB2|nr:hypothetical protein [Amycolatopsis sp. CA-230715]QWF81122.1 hypothetical protein HUW46_04548 [Amycolatopsis sp. CA-230715]
MTFYVTYGRLAEGSDERVHRFRHHTEPALLDCGKPVNPYDLFQLEPGDWSDDTACFGCANHLLTVTDGSGDKWREAADTDGKPSGLFALAGHEPAADWDVPELVPLVEIARHWGLTALE